ncbi:uncharacterized protein LOC119084897 [Bradysia coprophila]|uniref:uncharacterized protein LOC119084897 n=1 Tax=Bradysia coprophila TaxID=38358 RepID=UPI00187D8F4F|nr:uncharacterized protein LOC119084897 [Bradysia coprophila]XP_037050946.1 uncharacterized protein LOC119084897 [Bradysia coprophila]
MASNKVPKEAETSRSWVANMIKNYENLPCIRFPPLNLCTNATLRILVCEADNFPNARDEILLFAIRLGDEFKLDRYLRAKARVNLASSPGMTKNLRRMYLREAVAVCDHQYFEDKLRQFEGADRGVAERQISGASMPKESEALKTTLKYYPCFAGVLAGAAPPEPIENLCDAKDNIVYIVYIVYEGNNFLLLFIFKLDI